jgi:hypothetical protein
MILNPIRIVRCALIARDIDRNLAARRTARSNGQVMVTQHTRRK